MVRFFRVAALATLLLCAVAFTSALAETHVLKLKDGRILRGEFINATNGSIFFRVVGTTEAQRFEISDVLSVVFSSASVQATKEVKEPTVVPMGTMIRVTLDKPLSSKNGNAGQKFFASLAADLVYDGRTLAPAGKRVTGRVRKVVRPKRSIDKASIELVLISIPVDGADVPVITDYCGVTTDGKGNTSLTGTARIIGRAVDDLRDGKHVGLPAGVSVEFRLTQPMTIRN